MSETPSCDLGPLVVRASAGTGKTYQLTARLLRILLQGSEPDSILATTFTRKAAGEILDRLLLSLAAAADESNPAGLREIRQQVGVPTLKREACVGLLRKLVDQVHRLRIGTLDSLFSQLARSLPFELALPPAWRLTDEIEESWLTERAVEEVIRGLRPTEMTTLLAMLGKGDVRRSVTRDLIGVIQGTYAQQRQCNPDVWDRMQVPNQPPSSDVTRAAGHFRQVELPQKSLVKKLNEIADRLETRQFETLPEETLVANIATARRSHSEVKFGRSKFPVELDDDFDVLYAVARHETLSLLRAQNLATGTLLNAYHQQITRIKESLRTLGFDDIAARLAEHVSSLDPGMLSDRLDVAIDHLLLDEFQDTSPIQWQVLRPLAMHASQAVGDERRVDRSFFCVGDTKQAIYGWRGGVAEIFDAVAEQIEGVKTQEQNTSYRSSPIVIEFVNTVFKNLPRHPIASTDSNQPGDKAAHEADAVRRFAKQFPDHLAHHDTQPGYVRFETSRLNGQSSDDPQSILLEDAAARVASIHRSAPTRSIGVLTRTNRCVARMIFLLDSLGLPVSQEGGNPLTDSAAVEVVLSALMLSEHPGDGRWKYHIGSTRLANLLDVGQDDPPQRAAAQVRRLIDERGLTEAVEQLAACLAPVCDPRDTTRLRQLVRLAMQFEPNATPRVRDFVRLVREKRVERPRAAPIRVMTVHQAKGLEFDAVVLPELDGALVRTTGRSVPDVGRLGEPPLAMSRYLSSKSWHFLAPNWQLAYGRQASAAITEALCLLYVAVTRARYALYLIIPPATKSDFATRTAASLIYHAIQAPADPRAAAADLYQAGDPRWYDQLTATSSAPVDESSIEESEAESRLPIRFRPLPPVPCRNHFATERLAPDRMPHVPPERLEGSM